MFNNYRLIVGAIYQGGAAFQKAMADARGLQQATGDTSGTTKAISGFKSMHAAALGLGVALGAAALAAKQFYDTARTGATLITTQQRFDKLAASIGTTSKAMLGELRAATKGMISDMELMASASQIISLRLADNSDQVVRLSTVAGTLGWDMQQVILTFANMSTMRLDALGLSVEEVTKKAKELEAQGMSAQAAFKEAVILAGEARLEVGGVSEAEQAFKQAEAAVANFKNALLLSITATLDQAGAFQTLQDAAKLFNTGEINLDDVIPTLRNAKRIMAYRELSLTIQDLYDNSRITEEQYKTLNATLEHAGIAAAKAALETTELANWNKILTTAVGDNIEAYRAWSGATQTSMDMVGTASENMTRGILIDMDAIKLAAEEAIRLFGGAASSADQAMLNSVGMWQMEQNPAKYGSASRSAYWQYEQMKKAAEGMRSYGAAVSEVAAEEKALADAHARMADVFMSEIGGKLEDGLIGADGLVNLERANDLLMQQARAANLTAGEMAMLGLATGAYTEEQAQAALKAAILAEKIRQIAQYAAATGDIAGAGAAFNTFREQLDSGAFAEASAGLAGMVEAAEGFGASDYEATLSVEDAAARTAMQGLLDMLGQLTGTHTINLVTTTSGGLPEGKALGGPVTRGKTYLVGEVGPELFVPQQAGRIVPNGQLRDMASGVSGGSTYVVNVTNYVDGVKVERDALDDVTEDRMLAALRRLGLASKG